MEVSVISVSGLGTERAVIKTKHTQENAEKYCREYVRKVTQECIDEEMSIALNDTITANCRTGVFVDFNGAKHRFEGKLNRSDRWVQARYAVRYLSPSQGIRRPKQGELLDGSSASGYPTEMGIFKALCPFQAPAEFEW